MEILISSRRHDIRALSARSKAKDEKRRTPLHNGDDIAKTDIA